MVEEAGLETEGMAETTSQLQAKLLALTDGKVNIMIDENNFKNTTQILREMSAEWEHMTDVEQAAALELLGGKRQANTLSAIISNFDIVENAIEASANSAGSALEENAKVLDSIQGRINLFNNALQTMWNNTLDNNLIKDVVSLGTEIVKIADRIGLINSALIVLGAHKGFGALFKSLKEDGVTLKSIWTWVNQLTLATRQQQIADAAAVGTTLSRMNAEELLNISIVKRFATEQLDAKVKEANLTRDVVLVAAKQALALAEEQYAEGLIDDIALQTAKNAVDAASVPITTSQIGVTGVLSAMFKGLGVSIWGAVKAMAAFLFTNPVGWFILATAAVAGGVAIFNHFNKTTEELTEELSELKSELSDIRSEIDSLNSELETTQSRIAELLAKDKLSFTEQEELNNLQKQNDELQRQIDLIELKNKQKQKETAQKFNETMLSDSSDDKEYYADGSEANWISELGFMMGGAHGLSHPGYLSQSQIIDKKIEEYKEYANKLADIEQQIIDVGGEDTNKGKSLKKEKDEIDTKMSEIQTYINDKTTQWNENSEGLEYFTGDNLQDWQKQSNAWLDYINDVKDQWAIASSGTDAETNAITRIFNKEEFAEVSDTIDGLVKKLETDPTNNGIKNQIQSIIESNSELVSNLERVGLSADKATDAFTMFASNTAFDTISGKMEEINRASTIFEQLLSDDGYRNATEEMKNLGDAYNNLVNGNVDYNKRPFVSLEKMKKVFPDFNDEIATTFDMDETYGDGKGGVKYTLKFTPILEDGTILDKESYNEYINNIFTELDNANGDINKALEYDAANYNILINWQEGAVEYDDEGFSELDRQLDNIKQQHWELAKEIEPIKVEDLFDTDGNVNQIKLSEIFGNTSNEMRQDITSILEGSYDDIKKGTVKIEDLLTKFSLRTTEQFLRVQNNFISNQNKEWFPGLEDEISGIIDTFDELATAVGSIVDAMDTLEQARKEEEYSGSVSIETLAKLMEYTDDYSKIVSIDETGAIHLAADAQNILIQEKINGIKTNAEAAVQEAKLAYQNALAAESSVKFADVIAGSTIPQLDELAGAIAYAGSILGDLETAMADGFGGVTFSARNSMAKAETAYNSKISSRQSVRTQATSDAEEALRKAQDNLKIANGLTVDNVQSRYSSSVADGSKKDSSKDDAFQKAMDYWENRIAANQAKYEQIQNEIDLLEKQGKTAGEDYYKEQIKLENERLKLLQGQRAEAKKHLRGFKEGSEEWWEVASTLNDIEGEIDDVTASLQDLSDAIAQIKWDIFDESHTRFGNLKSQLETVRELVAPNSEEDWFDDEGSWTEKGVAVAGAYIQEIEIDENALEDTQKKLADFTKGYKGNEKYFKNTYGIDSEQEYYDKRQELIEQEQEYAKNINSNKQAVIDMYEAQIDAVEEYTSKLIDSYNEYIDTVKEALDAERDLYEFKKDITKQTKDIAQIERRIASLSGSDNAADIAERRKLEAELAEAKEGLNDSYYAHSKDALQNALEEEATAYEETMNKFIEGLRESLNTALQDMDLFMEGVFNAVITNAPSILEQYQNLGIALDDAITNPWEKASEAIIKFGGVDGLGIMNSWINEGGIFPTFKTSATNALKSPWEAGKTALGSFKQSVDTEMKNIVKTIESNVSSAKTKLNSLTSAIQDTNKQASSSSNSSNSSSSSKSSYSGSSTNYITGEHVRTLQKILNQFFGAKLTVDGSYGPATTNAVKAMKNTLYKSAGYGTGNIPAKTATNGKYDAETKSMLQTYLNKWNVGSWFRENKLSIPAPMYAKGTLGTKRDEFAITDESWIGEEITLAAGKNGQLQYLKKGSAVMPADISANLVEWGKLNPNMMNIANPSAGINLMTNYVSKPELNLSFDALVKAGTITQEALPAVKELVQQELNKFTKQLNYSMKRIGAN